MDAPMSQEQQHMWRLFGKYSAVGMEMVIALCLGAFVGTKVDAHFQWKQPWGLMFGMLVGSGAAVKTVMRLIRDAQRASARPAPPDQN